MIKEEIIEGFINVYKGKRLNQQFTQDSMDKSVQRYIGDKWYMTLDPNDTKSLCEVLVKNGNISKIPSPQWTMDHSQYYKVNKKLSKDDSKMLSTLT